MAGRQIGNRVSIGAGTVVRNPEVSSDSIVYRDSNTGVVMRKSNQKDNCVAQNCFKDDLNAL